MPPHCEVHNRFHRDGYCWECEEIQNKKKERINYEFLQIRSQLESFSQYECEVIIGKLKKEFEIE